MRAGSWSGAGLLALWAGLWALLPEQAAQAGPKDPWGPAAFMAAREHQLNGFQLLALQCLRRIENGGPGREYGVLHPRAKDTDELTQARWAAASIKKRLPDISRLDAFAGRWAPIGAANDPTGLNRHWLGNMTACLAEEQPVGTAQADL